MTVKLIGEQCRILYLSQDNNQVILGVAGSGKSVEAIYRAVWISMIAPDERVVLLTCNHEVNRQLALLLSKIGHYPNIFVDTVYHFCKEAMNAHYPQAGPIRQRLQRVGKRELVATTSNEEAQLIRAATELVKQQEPDESFWKRPGYQQFVRHEIRWLQANGIDTAAKYQEVERVGRSDERLTRAQRPLIYRIFSEFQRRRVAETGKSYGFNDIYWAVADLDIPEDQKAKYIIIDEVQDVSPAMFGALKNLIRSDGHWSVFGDLSQNIFGQRISWSSLGLNDVRKQYRLRKNYRNSTEIGELAANLLEKPYFDHGTSFITPLPGPRQVAKPVLKRFTGDYAELIDILARRPQGQSCAVICMNQEDCWTLQKKLTSAGVSLNSNIERYRREQVYLQTINRVKGLEFDNVVLFGLDSSTGNEPETVVNRDKRTLKIGALDEDALAIVAKRIYVAITRARNGLILFYQDSTLPQLINPELVQEEDNEYRLRRNCGAAGYHPSDSLYQVEQPTVHFRRWAV